MEARQFILTTRVVFDSAVWIAYSNGCKWTKTKFNSFSRGVGSVNLDDRMDGDVLGVDHTFQTDCSDLVKMCQI